MSMVITGFFSFDYSGYMGALQLTIYHGFTSPALFYFIGITYFYISTRFNISMAKGYTLDNKFKKYLLFFLYTNIGIPPSCTFWAELYIYKSLINIDFFMCMCSIFISIISIIYTIRFYFILLQPQNNHYLPSLANLNVIEISERNNDNFTFLVFILLITFIIDLYIHFIS